jgi:molybdate transport repressor ModE-like protein
LFESTLHRLRIFQTVIESGSFSAAAQKLGITQPAISAHIKALEQELGKQLFTRRPGKKTTLNDDGEMLYFYTLEITSKTNQVELTFKQKLQEKKKQVSIVTQPHIAHILLPGYLSKFNKIHPNIDMLIYTQTFDTVIRYVVEGKSDLGIINPVQPNFNSISTEGLHSEILSSKHLEFFLVVGPTHELANRSSIDPCELENYGFVGPLTNTIYSKMTNLYLKKKGINQHNVVIQIEDVKTIIEVVKQGIGVACFPSTDVLNEIKAGRLVRLPLQSEMFQTDVRLIYKTDLKMSDEARQFMVFLRREMDRAAQKLD